MQLLFIPNCPLCNCCRLEGLETDQILHLFYTSAKEGINLSSPWSPEVDVRSAEGQGKARHTRLLHPSW